MQKSFKKINNLIEEQMRKYGYWNITSKILSKLLFLEKEKMFIIFVD